MKDQQLVKVKDNGKVSVLLLKSMTWTFKQLLELFMNDFDRKLETLNIASVNDHINVWLVSEVYSKHYAVLHLANRDTRLLLTRSQALAVWRLSQKYKDLAYQDASLSGLLLQLHQKLIS